MSVLRLRRIVCDHPGCRNTVEAADFEDASATYIRRQGYTQGWVRHSGKDFCQEHAERKRG